MPSVLKELWECPKCDAKLVSPNMWHSCGQYSLGDLFSRSEPEVFYLFERLAEFISKFGSIIITPQKTRVTFQARVRFISVYPRKNYILVGIWLKRRIDSPRFSKVEDYGSVGFVHYCKLHRESEMDDELREWVKESYEVG